MSWFPRAQHMASLHSWQRLPSSNPANPTAALGRSPNTTNHKWQRQTATNCITRFFLSFETLHASLNEQIFALWVIFDIYSICLCQLFASPAALSGKHETTIFVLNFSGTLLILGSNMNCWVDNKNNSKIIHKKCSLHEEMGEEPTDQEMRS